MTRASLCCLVARPTCSTTMPLKQRLEQMRTVGKSQKHESVKSSTAFHSAEIPTPARMAWRGTLDKVLLHIFCLCFLQLLSVQPYNNHDDDISDCHTTSLGDRYERRLLKCSSVSSRQLTTPFACQTRLPPRSVLRIPSQILSWIPGTYSYPQRNETRSNIDGL